MFSKSCEKQTETGMLKDEIISVRFIKKLKKYIKLDKEKQKINITKVSFNIKKRRLKGKL